MLKSIRTSLIAGLLLLSACTTTIAIREFNQDKSPFPVLKGKSIALVIDQASVPNDVTTQSETQTFEFVGMADRLQEALKSQIESSGAKMEVVKAWPDKGFDLVLKPQLTIRSVYDFWTYGCLATYKLEIFGKDKDLRASASGEAKRNFAFTGQSHDKCNQALSDLVKDVNEKALVRVSR